MTTGRLFFLVTRLRHASWRERAHRAVELSFWMLLGRWPRLFDWLAKTPQLPVNAGEELVLPQIFLERGATAKGDLPCGAPTRSEVDGQEIRPCVPKTRQDLVETDIRSLWEPARLQEVARLLHEGCQQGDEAASACKTAKQMLFQWLRDNPFLSRPHYLSAMECGLRLPVLLAARKTLDLSDEERLLLDQAIFEHGWFVRHRLSLYSSLGNHTVAESVGLIVAGAFFAGHARQREWLALGVRLLEQELPHQVAEDGGPAEQSLSYHRFVLDLYWFAADFLQTNSLHDCTSWKARLLQGEAFLAALTDCRGVAPAIGDSDDGHAIAPGLTPRRERPTLASVQEAVRTFPQSGYTVLRGACASMLILDHGPLGMPPLYNHGHADALSLTLSLQGRQMLVDPGTYRYNGAPPWRRYFKGTRAHNTVTIDGLDQAVQETSFIWSRPYGATLVSCRAIGSGFRLEAAHDGYTRLPQPVEHRRSLLWSDEGWLVVKDTFAGRGCHNYELNWHLHPEAAVVEERGWWRVRGGEVRLGIRLLSGEPLSHVRGQDSPILGWYAPAYGIKCQSGVLQALKSGEPDEVSFVTAMFFGEEPDQEVLLKSARAL